MVALGPELLAMLEKLKDVGASDARQPFHDFISNEVRAMPGEADAFASSEKVRILPGDCLYEGERYRIGVCDGDEQGLEELFGSGEGLDKVLAELKDNGVLVVPNDFYDLPLWQQEAYRDNLKERFDVQIVPLNETSDFLRQYRLTRDMSTPPEVLAESPFSSFITESIRTMKELEIYKALGLEESTVNGKQVLTNPDIDPNRKDEFGYTNLERMKEGKPPIGSDGKPMELHHIGQKPDAPLAELTQSDHRTQKAFLHDSESSEISHHKGDWPKERQAHWKDRAKQFEAQGISNS